MTMFGRLALVAGILLPFCDPALAEERPEPAEAENDEIIVQATRSGRRVQDEPVRVEVINREEVEEKILMRPGNIAMLLSETGGLRVQVTSPALQSANIRVQGMDGRFTQLLADGLPLYGGQASSLGLLQIPPTDLGQVEVIKGAASALYGASALGGVINLVSRRPGTAPQYEALLNATSRGGQDATAYTAAPLGAGWSASVTGGLHRQRRQDLDNDGWADIPSYRRWAMRPRLFWEGAAGQSLFVTSGAMHETRTGGTLPGQTVPDGSRFEQGQDTDRFDGGLVAHLPIADTDTAANIRLAGMSQRHRHMFGDAIERDRHGTLFAEVSLSRKQAGTSWVGGMAWQEDRFRSRTFPAFDYRYSVPGVFGQIDQRLTTSLTLAGSGRMDFHNRYGTKFSPRLSLLYRSGPWTIRASGGRGFYASTPFIEEIEAAGLSRLQPLAGLGAETARTTSLDVGYKKGPLEANVVLFGSDTNGVTQLEPVTSNLVRLINARGTRQIRGVELLLRRRWGELVLTGNYVHLNASEPNPENVGRRTVALTPKDTAGIVAMWEKSDRGRVGLEVYYTGRQSLDDNPYRSVSRPYLEIGLLGEIVLGKVRLFANAENILGTRQTKYDPLIRPFRAPDGRWTVDVWAPTDGFVLNAGVRLRFGKLG